MKTFLRRNLLFAAFALSIGSQSILCAVDNPVYSIGGQPVVSRQDYMFYVFLPGRSSPVITGIQTIEWLKNDEVRGFCSLAAPSKIKYAPAKEDDDWKPPVFWGWSLVGENQTKGLMTGSLAEQEGWGFQDETSRKTFGSLKLHKTIRGYQVWWEGELQVDSPKVVESRIPADWLSARGLYPYPAKLNVRMVRFLQSNADNMMSEAGSYPGIIGAGWMPENESGVRQWLSSRGYSIQNDGNGGDWFARLKDGRLQHTIEVPGFDENVIVWEMLASGWFSEAMRLGVELDSGREYLLTVPSKSIFANGHAPQTAPAEALAYGRSLLEKLRLADSYREVTLGELIYLSNYKMKFSVVGRSHLMRSDGDEAYWDKADIQIDIRKHFDLPDDEVFLAVSSQSERTAKSPGDTPPGDGRFEEIRNDSDLLPKLGSKLGDLCNALARRYD